MKVARRSLVFLWAGTVLGAWSPRFHEAQTRLARRLVPKAMARILLAHEADLLEGARGVASDQVPTVEEVEEQFQRILALSEAGKPMPILARELGILAKQVQLLSDPSATVGVTPFRATFEGFADEHLREMVVAREPMWALRGPLDPKPHLLGLVETKYARHRVLAPSLDPESGRRLGVWDRLSIPYAELQLSFSTGVNASANLFILAWRAAGGSWAAPEAGSPRAKD